MNCNDSMINNSILKKRNDPGKNFQILAISNRHLCNQPFEDQIKRVCEWHPDALVLREKDLPEDEYKALAKIFWISVKLTMSHVSYILTGKQRWSLDMMPFICHCLCYGSYLPSRRLIYKVRIRQSRRVFMLQTSIKSAHLFILSRMPWKQNGSVRPM